MPVRGVGGVFLVAQDPELDQLTQAGVAVDSLADYDYGKFAWLTDPEGNPLELYEPL